MVNWKNQSHALCLLASVGIHALIPAISIQVSASIVAPSLLLNTSPLLKDVYTCDPRIRLLFIQKSDCPESVSRCHWIRFAGVGPLSEISGGLWKLSLLDKVRFLEPPWMSSFYACSRQWDGIAIFKPCVMRIVFVAKTTGGREVFRWGFGLQNWF